LGLRGRKKQETEEHFIMKYYIIRTSIYLYIWVIKSTEMNRACGTHKVAQSNCTQGMVGKCEGMKSHRRLRCRWENNIKMDLKRKKMEGHGLDSSS